MKLKLGISNYRLREFKASDLESYQQLRSHPFYGRHLYSSNELAPSFSKELLTKFISQQQLIERTSYQLAIEYTLSGVVVGSCGIRKSSDASASIGFELHPDHRRQGIIQTALKVMIYALSDSLKIDSLHAEVLKINTPSIQLLKKLGFSNRPVMTADSDWQLMVAGLSKGKLISSKGKLVGIEGRLKGSEG